MKVEKHIRIDAPLDRAWEVAAERYDRAGDWASSVFVSRGRTGAGKVEAPFAGRVCETSLGPFTETIEVFDPARGHLAYSATGAKMPGFVKLLRNDWHFATAGARATDLHMVLTAELAGPAGLVMALPMRMQFSKVLADASEEFRYFVETGKPHPRKVKVDASKKAAAARQAFA